MKIKTYMGVIYKITSPTGKIYIGQTSNFRSRFSQYKKLRCKDQPGIYNSFIKYGFEKHSFEVIYNAPIELLDYLEEMFIRLYNSVKNGLNCTTGGNRPKLSLEARNKISESNRRRTISDETKQKIGIANKGNQATKGYKHSDETKRKISEKAIGRPSPFRKSILVYNDEFSKEFSSIVEAAIFFTGKPRVSGLDRALKYNKKFQDYHVIYI